MVDRTLFSSRDDDWETPQDLFDRLNAVFDFRLDASAAAHNTKCARYFTKDDDALVQDWRPYKRIWLNPPYGRAMPAFMRKAYEESRRGCIVVCLVSSRTDTRWWHDWVAGKAAVWFVKGRLRFKNPTLCPDEPKYGSPFPSAIVVYGLDLDRVLNCRPGDPDVGDKPGPRSDAGRTCDDGDGRPGKRGGRSNGPRTRTSNARTARA